MRLFLSPTSPFAREVKVALVEKGLLDSIEQVVVDPWASPAELLAVNPLSQVPTLELDDGQILTNSTTILQWLEIAHPVPPLLPGTPADSARVLAVAALAHCLIESVVYVVIEGRKPIGQQSDAMLTRRREGINRVLDALERKFTASQEAFMLDGLHLGCALEYVDLRLPDFDWRSRCPRLARWLEWASVRPSLKQSAPPGQ
jgi:glutathione S-transferase